MARRDDDALSWGGDDDPTLNVSTPGEPATKAAPAAAPVSAPKPLPDGFAAVGRGSDGEGQVAAIEPEAAAEHHPMGNATLVTLGVIGGVYLLFALGWFIGGTRLQGMAQFLVTDVVFQISLWLAICAPVVWFGTVLVVTQRRAAWLRLAWLAAGLILLVPWPFIAVGAMGTV